MTNKQKNQEIDPSKLTAAQRLAFLEKAFDSVQGQIEILAQEIDNLRSFSNNMSKKVDASVAAAGTETEVEKIQKEQIVKELKERIDGLLQVKALLHSDKDEEATEEHFVVGRELNSDKTLLNPRTQFALIAIEPDIKDKVLGKKVGDLVEFGEDDNKTYFELTELYRLNRKGVQQDYEDTAEDVDEALSKSSEVTETKDESQSSGNETAVQS